MFVCLNQIRKNISTGITEVNLSAFSYSLFDFHKDFSSIDGTRLVKKNYITSQYNSLSESPWMFYPRPVGYAAIQFLSHMCSSADQGVRGMKCSAGDAKVVGSNPIWIETQGAYSICSTNQIWERERERERKRERERESIEKEYIAEMQHLKLFLQLHWR